MPSGKPICGHCGAPAPGATICTACERDLTAALVAVIALGPDLDVALARQAVIGDRSHTARHTAPLPYDEHASDVIRYIHDLLGDWYSAVAEAG